MSKSKDQTEKYVIIRRGVRLKDNVEQEVGAVVELTKKKAKALINKVELLSNHQAGKSNKGDQAKVKSLSEEIAELKAKNAELLVTVGELTQ